MGRETENPSLLREAGSIRDAMCPSPRVVDFEYAHSVIMHTLPNRCENVFRIQKGGILRPVSYATPIDIFEKGDDREVIGGIRCELWLHLQSLAAHAVSLCWH